MLATHKTSFFLVFVLAVSFVKGQGPTTFQACNTACNKATVICYKDAGFVFGVHSLPACGFVQSLCMIACNNAPIAANAFIESFPVILAEKIKLYSSASATASASAFVNSMAALETIIIDAIIYTSAFITSSTGAIIIVGFIAALISYSFYYYSYYDYGYSKHHRMSFDLQFHHSYEL